MHIGIQSLKPNAANYDYQIKVGTPIVTLSEELLKKHNYKIITPIVICNHYSHPIKAMTTASSIKAGKTIYTYR